MDSAVDDDLPAFISEALCCVNLALKDASVEPIYCFIPSSDDTVALYIRHSSKQLFSRGHSLVFLQLQFEALTGLAVGLLLDRILLLWLEIVWVMFGVQM